MRLGAAPREYPRDGLTPYALRLTPYALRLTFHEYPRDGFVRRQRPYALRLTPYVLHFMNILGTGL